MSQRVAQGGTITLEATFRTGSGALVDPGDVDVDVFDANRFQVPYQLQRVGLGQWIVTVDIGEQAVVGIWTAEWSGVISQVLVRAREQFEVVGAGQVGTGGYTLIVNPMELVSYLSDVSLTDSQAQSAQDILEGVQDGLELWLNRPVVRAARTERVWVDELGRAWPKATPIESVGTVGVELGEGNMLHVLGAASALGVSAGGRYLTLSYVGGLDGHNMPALRLAVLRVAAREVTARHDDTMSVKGLALRNEGEPVQNTPIGWTDDELLKLQRHQRRTVVSGY